MAYFPPTGSTVAFQDDPSKLQASITGVVNLRGNPSVSGTVNIGNFPTTQNVSGSVLSFQSGTQISSLVSTVPSSVIVGASIFGLPPVNVTNTNLNVGGSVLTFQAGTNIASLVSTVPSSVIVGASIFGLAPVNVTNTNVNVGGSVVTFPTLSSTSSVYAVLSSLSTVSVLNANTARKGATIYNAAGTIVYLQLGTAATTSIYTVALDNLDYYEVPFNWTGVVAGITASNAGIINVTELT